MYLPQRLMFKKQSLEFDVGNYLRNPSSSKYNIFSIKEHFAFQKTSRVETKEVHLDCCPMKKLILIILKRAVDTLSLPPFDTKDTINHLNLILTYTYFDLLLIINFDAIFLNLQPHFVLMLFSKNKSFLLR